MPIAILKSSAIQIKKIKDNASLVQGIIIVDVTNAAQTTKSYQEYTEKILSVPQEQLLYLGIALYGDKNAVNRLTGSLGLLK